MTTYVALLYSIMLGPGRRVVMADLKRMAEHLDFRNARTVASTGNLVFETGETAVDRLERLLEAAFERTFGRHVDIIVREAVAWRKLAAGNPFPEESATAADRVGVKVMRAPVSSEAVSFLEHRVSSNERMRMVDGDVWIVFSRDAGTSRLLSALTSKRMGIGTSRNWNTVRKLAEMVGG